MKQPRSQGLSSLRPGERDVKRRDPGNEIEAQILQIGVVLFYFAFLLIK